MKQSPHCCRVGQNILLVYTGLKTPVTLKVVFLHTFSSQQLATVWTRSYYSLVWTRRYITPWVGSVQNAGCHPRTFEHNVAPQRRVSLCLQCKNNIILLTHNQYKNLLKTGCDGYIKFSQQLWAKAPPPELWVTHDEKLWLSSMPRLVGNSPPAS